MVKGVEVGVARNVFVRSILFSTCGPGAGVPLGVLMGGFVVSTCSFGHIAVMVVGVASEEVRVVRGRDHFAPFFIFTLPSGMSYFVCVPPSCLLDFLPGFHKACRFYLLFSTFRCLLR